jgi:hypothetical protein
MTDESKNDPAKKMRNLLGGAKTSPMTRLPRKGDAAASILPTQEDAILEGLPQKKESPSSGPIQSSPKAASSMGLKFNFGPPFWTFASIISLSVNVILVVILLTLLFNINRFNLGNVTNLGNGFLGGLFTNFEKMDRAHITSNIQVNTTIPVKFVLQLNQQTNVILSQDVTIDNAVVTVKTGGLNITNALTTIVLPKGTSLPIVLNLSVPVDTTVPVTLTVPVDIPLDQSQLHEPFVGLQEVVKPFYCMINSAAVDLNDQPICK